MNVWGQRYCCAHEGEDPEDQQRCASCDWIAGPLQVYAPAQIRCAWPLPADRRRPYLCDRCLVGAVCTERDGWAVYAEVASYFRTHLLPHLPPVAPPARLELRLDLWPCDSQGRRAHSRFEGRAWRSMGLPPGYSRAVTAALVAHELRHAYFCAYPSTRPDSPELEEGLCDLAAVAYLVSAARRAIPLLDPQCVRRVLVRALLRCGVLWRRDALRSALRAELAAPRHSHELEPRLVRELLDCSYGPRIPEL